MLELAYDFLSDRCLCEFDMSNDEKLDFVHLHNHSHYSLLDGLPKLPDMVKRAKSLGMKAIALTDHGAMYGAVEFYEAAVKAEIKPIIGVEAYVAPYKLSDKRPRIDDKYSHMILLARDLEGYRNLMKLTSIAHLEGYYYKPRIDKEVLKKYGAGLIGLSGCLKGEINGSILAGHPDRSKELIKEYQNILGAENFYLELQHHPNLPEQKTVNDGLIKLAREMKVPLVATGDVHYLNKDDAEAQDILVCVSTGKTVGDKDRMDMRNIDASLKSPEEMASFFPDQPEAIENTVKIAERCKLEIPLKKLHFPKYDIPQGYTADTCLREKAYLGLAGRYKLAATEKVDGIKSELDAKDKTISERLEYELGIISKKGYSEYFLVVADFVNWARQQGIITTTRGSAAGCLTSYGIGISDINPLEYKLPFERFLNPFRPSPPDIDLDIADNRRHELVEYAVKKYGREKVANIITFGTMMARAAARDVGRALGMPYEKPDRIAKLIPLGSQGFPMYIDRAKKDTPELMSAYNNEPDTKKLLDLAEKVEGCCRHASVHAAGVVIAPDDLMLHAPVQLDTDGGGWVVQYDMNACESVGLVKMDFLGIRNLSILQEAIRYVEKIHGVKVQLESIPLDDKKTFEMLARGETFGVFQLGGSGMTKYLVELKPEKIFDIMAMIALYRPGPIESIPDYIKRKHNPKLVKVLDPRLKPILEMSYGVITFQDDVLLTAINISGYTWEEADKLRKAMGKKIPEEMAKQKEKFIKGAIEKGGLTPEKADKLFKLIEPFAAYGFNKAHAASYAHISYYTGYMKANYPVEYMAALMSAESGDLEKVGEALKECARMNVNVLPPDINESFSRFGVVKGTRNIRFGLTAVKNVGEGIVEAIIEERKLNGPYKNLEDFVLRAQDKNLNKKTLESLAKTGALDRFADRNAILENMEALLNFGRSTSKAKAAGQKNLFGSSSTGASESLAIKLTPSTPVTLLEKLKWEKELLGLYISQHPFQDLAAKLKDVVWPINRLKEGKKGTVLMVGGMVTKTKKVTTKKGEQMLFAELEDLHGSVELVIFPKIYFNVSHMIREDAFFLVKGKLDDKEGDPKILVDTVVPIGPENIDKIVDGFAEMRKVMAQARANAGITTAASSSQSAGAGMATAASAPAGKQPGPNATALTGVGQPVIQKEKAVTIQLPANFDQETTNKLRDLFSRHPGDKKVYVKIINSPQSRVETPFKIDLPASLRREIEQLTGQGSIEVV